MKCRWCKGTGEIKLIGKGYVLCLNCKGTKLGGDGGHTLQKGIRPSMNTNQSQRRKVT